MNQNQNQINGMNAVWHSPGMNAVWYSNQRQNARVAFVGGRVRRKTASTGLG